MKINIDQAGSCEHVPFIAPKASVIIPTYNRAHLISRAIYSVLSQTYQDFEVILVDDASTDNTREVIRAIDDPRICYVRHLTNRGPSAARNTGIKQARGQYIGLLDSDDKWLPTKLERQVDVLDSNPDIALVYGGWEWVSESTGKVEARRVPDESGRILGLPRWAFNISLDLLIRRDVLQKNLYDEQLRTYMEYDLLLRLASKYRFGCLSQLVVTCYSHTGPRNSDRRELERAATLARLLQSHEQFMRQDLKAWARFNLILGSFYLRHLKESHLARRHLWRVVAARPLYWRGWAYAIASFCHLRCRVKRA